MQLKVKQPESNIFDERGVEPTLNKPITNTEGILPDAYDRACVHRGYHLQFKIRVALSKTLADCSKAQLSNHRAVTEAFAFFAARHTFGRDVHMNANGVFIIIFTTSFLAGKNHAQLYVCCHLSNYRHPGHRIRSP